MNGKRRYIAVLSLLIFGACSQKEIVPVEEAPVLKSVDISLAEVALSSGSMVEVPFTVNSPSFSFNYSLGTPNCQIVLLKQGGRIPENYSLVSVQPQAVKGAYTAMLKDTGRGEVYKDLVCLAIYEKSGGDSFVNSAYFTVRSEQQTTRLPVQTGLPVVYIDTEGGKGIHSKEEEVPASLFIRGEGEWEGLQPVSCRVRGRGNSTWYWPKKPYLVKLDQKASLFGLPKHKRWVLLANFCDRTLMRNLVSMKVSSMTSLAWTPGCVPVELVLDGKHLGNYLLMEQVRVDGHRVNVGDDGYLLECDWHYDNPVQWLDPHGHYYGSNGKVNGIPFGVKNPDPDEITAEQLSHIKSYITSTANALYGNNFTNPETGYARYLDVDSFIDYWLVFEIMCNHELGNPGSVFMHKTRDGLLCAGPCWDFDWGILSFYTSAGETRLVNGKAIWYERLFQDPAFAEKVKARFNELLPQLETIPAYMDQCEALLTESAKLNFKLWNPADDKSLNGGQIINGDENLSFHDAVQRLKRNYEKHLQVMQAQL